MDNFDEAKLSRNSRWGAYVWGALAVLTCPCHLPLLAAVLAGTTAGAVIGENLGMAVVAATGLFALFLTQAIRAFKQRARALGDRRH